MYSYSSFLNVFIFCGQKNKSIRILGEVKLSQRKIHRGRADNILSECILPLFCLIFKIYRYKNFVCYRKDKAAGTQFLPAPCDIPK